MEEFKKRLEEQNKRHQGGNKMDRYRRHLAVRGRRLQPGRHPRRPAGAQQERGQGLGKARIQEPRRQRRTGHRNIKVALRRLRKFARTGAAEELDLDDTIRSTARNAGLLDIKMVPSAATR
jgi:uncharacterized protein with von Willebrand factor type A (vWA) domain